MKVDVPSPDRVAHVVANLRQSDVDEFLALSAATDRAALADILVEKYSEHPAGYCFLDGDEPVGVGAMIEARPNVITLMFFGTEKFAGIANPLAKFTRQRLFPRYRDAGAHRIECVSIEGYAQMHRWIRTVGLSQEAVMPGYGKGGETFIQFAWVADDVR